MTLIYLVGLPGSGKTTIGRLLARRFRLEFIDTDHVLEERLGCSIRTYFEREGEDAFRDAEQAVLADLSGKKNTIISTGGGIVLREANRTCLKNSGKVIYLRSSPEELFKRLRRDTQRPLLQVEDPFQTLKKLYEIRDPLYKEVASYTLETGRPSVATLVNMIVMQLEMSGVLAEHTTGLVQSN